jgi:hypothetical protein
MLTKNNYIDCTAYITDAIINLYPLQAGHDFHIKDIAVCIYIYGAVAFIHINYFLLLSQKQIVHIMIFYKAAFSSKPNTW